MHIEITAAWEYQHHHRKEKQERRMNTSPIYNHSYDFSNTHSWRQEVRRISDEVWKPQRSQSGSRTILALESSKECGGGAGLESSITKSNTAKEREFHRTSQQSRRRRSPRTTWWRQSAALTGATTNGNPNRPIIAWETVGHYIYNVQWTTLLFGSYSQKEKLNALRNPRMLYFEVGHKNIPIYPLVFEPYLHVSLLLRQSHHHLVPVL